MLSRMVQLLVPLSALPCLVLDYGPGTISEGIPREM